MNIDLHTRSRLSGGFDTPRELVSKAAEVGLSALALCDVLCVSGLPEAQQTAGELGIEFIPAVEVPCYLPRYETQVQLIGYYINPEHPALSDLLEKAKTTLPTVGQAAAVLREAGALVAFADPKSCGITGMSLDGFMQSVRCCGVEFVEVLYTGYTTNESHFWLDTAKEWSMDPVGGSGYGNTSLHASLGQPQVDGSVLDWMRQCKGI